MPMTQYIASVLSPAAVWRGFCVWCCLALLPLSAVAAAPSPPPPSVTSETIVTQAPLPEPAFEAIPAYIKAKKLASASYRKPENMAPDFLRVLSETQWNNVRFRQDYRLWNRDNLPFEISFYHQGFLYNQGVMMNVIDDSQDIPVPFATTMFDYNDEAIAEKARKSALQFAGFRLHNVRYTPMDEPKNVTELASYIGAAYFKSVSKRSRYGLSARGLALNTALSDGEEFPWFREFWFVKPEKNAASITIHALMDSPSMTGAFRFVIKPGTSTVMDVECRFFARKNTPLPQKIGFAPLTSMFLFSETVPCLGKDYRPEVHNSDGLLYTTGDNAWFWSPLANPGRLAVNTFAMTNPQGFGLMQRDNNFDHYQDIAARFDQRPSLWVEPLGDWGAGRIELIEIPSTEEIHDNIVAFWVSDKAENELFQDNEVGLAYRLYWLDTNVTPHSLGKAVSSRMVRSTKSEIARFIIDFEGDSLNGLPADTGLSSVINTPEDAPLLEKTLIKNPVTGGWRLDFTVRLPRQDGMVQSLISAREGSPRLHFSALLKKGENLPDALTEVWLYDLPS